MIILLVFLLGFSFSSWIQPLLDTWLQQFQSKEAMKITKSQVEATKIAEDSNIKDKISAIGFTIPQEEGEEYEDD